MELDYPYKITVKLPGDLEYIPSIRKFVSEVLQVSGFSSKFAFRSEIIVDEICNNAVSYGSDNELGSEVELICEIFKDRIEFVVKDKGGKSIHTDRLKDAINKKSKSETFDPFGLGLEIVKMLSESIKFEIGDNNVTSIHIVRKRETANQS